MKPIVPASITCPGTMIGKPGGYGITKLADTISRAVLQPLVDLRAHQRQVLAVVFLVGGEEGSAHVALERDAARILAVAVVEAAEVRQVGHVRHQALHPRRERSALGLAALGQPRLDLHRDLEQHLDQHRDVAAGVVDVALQQHAVARGLVELDVVVRSQQILERGAVVAGGAAHQRHARRVEDEFVLAASPSPPSSRCCPA